MEEQDRGADGQRFQVVRNDAEQYSIWPADRTLPAGWHAEGFAGSRAECLEHVGRIWTDLRPAHLRMSAAGNLGA
jgi:MbtH protein